ncbi:hypothetical protein EJ08DRAFT_97320 [Tothia fuscella]|uniref:Ras-GAP domain-containing protein n=1 Tax=Tothia fuscella TaxID=1048955 RepID=A0A9P4NEJ4_9PEZI|nr:hypothetical protein EJ08DRAFT_97320 [Tothia fuscella]
MEQNHTQSSSRRRRQQQQQQQQNQLYSQERQSQQSHSRHGEDQTEREVYTSRHAKSREDVGYSSRQPYGSTIRTVTPESIPEGETLHSLDHFNPSSPPTSPNSNAHESPNQASSGRHNRIRAGSSNDNRQIMAMRELALRDSASRPRTRTLDERPHREISPAGMFNNKSRNRMGSAHSMSSAGFTGVEEDAVMSIGHPAIIASNFAAPLRSRESRAKLVKSHSRAPESGPSSSPPQRRQSAVPHSEMELQVPLTDTRKILQLMKSSRGRMEGPLAFRRAETVPWSLSYCSINDESGSLVYEPKSHESFYRTLVPDLRGCNIRPAYDAESKMPYLDVCPQNSKLKVHLRPHSQEEFDSWFAALLCWQPIRPKGIQNRMTKPIEAAGSTGRRQMSRRASEVSLLKEAPIIKVGKMIYWDTNVSYSYAGTPKGGKPQPSRMQSFGSRRWRRISCTLRENGELKLYSEQDSTMVSCVQLSQLCRCAVQRLDTSVLDNDFCLAIYPQYSAASSQELLLRPIFLSLESRVLYEVWLVLLRAFTIPQLYGPKHFSDEPPPVDSDQSTTSQSPGDMFRMERSLSLRVVEARLLPFINPLGVEEHEKKKPEKKSHIDLGGYYAEVLLDGETRGRTMVKDEALNPFWREEFEFQDLPAVLSVASILLRKRPPSHVQNERSMHKEMKRIHDTINSADAGGGQTGISFDQTSGKVDIYLDDLVAGKPIEKWWPLVNLYGQSIGDVLVSVTTEESVILMARDYQPMSELLHRFSNGLTLQLAQMVPGELRKLSEYLLNIFQVSGSASDWIMSLVEEEIDGTLRETPTSRLRFSRRANSNESGGEGTQFGPIVERELLIRDMGKTATLEANLLFRGNTLLTKSLDLHMKRLGKEYLEEVLGDKLKEIADKDPDCEVDPNRVGNLNDLDRNWRKLIAWTSECWKCIYSSAMKCPAELRFIFRHIRACAEDRYGDYLRTVAYSSVSGFLFLRFFVPAILNPKLFGLLKDHPKANARRALTLIAKSLQGLANMTTFGSKEQWMEPMNTFMSAHRQEFKSFLDNVCAISSSNSPVVPIPPSYSTPLAILTRLPPTSREGFPSLPYLIDHARNFAALVALWLDHAGNIGGIMETDGDLLKFHNLVVSLRQRTEDCLASAERAERPSSSLSFKWEELVEQLENTSTQVGPRSMPHSRVGSTATSVAGGRSESPTGRNLSIDTTTVETSQVGSKSHTNQTDQSSPNSATTSPYATSDSQPGDSEYTGEGIMTPKSASVNDEKPVGHASITKNNVPRTMYGHGYVEGWTKSREALKVREGKKTRQISMSQRAARGDFGVVSPPMPMPTARMPSDSPSWHNTPQSSPYRDERSWLGDKVSTPGDNASNGFASDRAHKPEIHRNGESSSTNATPSTNGRPTRVLDGHQRHAAQVQAQAEQMEPGDYKPPRREPRRDWAAEDRQRYRGEEAQRADSSSRDSATGGPESGSRFGFGPSAYHQQQSRSQPSSTPGSRLGSRQPSMSSSDNEEGTTALPRMGAVTVGRVGEGNEGRREGVVGAVGVKEKEKHLFKTFGFKKRK